MEDDRDRGLFGIKLRMPTAQELENLLHPKKKGKEEPITFTYIPELNLSVADKVSMLEKNWYECKQELKERSSKMLTPREFWIYYDYCIKNRQEIIRDSFYNLKEDEWFDAVVENKKDMRIHTDVGILEDQHSYTGGSLYQNVVPTENGRFDYGDINSQTGMPSFLKKHGEFSFMNSFAVYGFSAVCRYIKFDELNQSKLLLCLEPLHFKSLYRGVREAYQGNQKL